MSCYSIKYYTFFPKLLKAMMNRMRVVFCLKVIFLRDLCAEYFKLSCLHKTIKVKTRRYTNIADSYQAAEIYWVWKHKQN